MPARFIIAVIAVTLMAGCSSPSTLPTVDPSTSAPVPSASPTTREFDPDATADDTLAFFDSIVAPLETDDGLPAGKDVIAALVAAGFDPALMELTADKTAIGLDADSIEFSVKQNGACIIGQFGSFGYRSVVMPLLDTDKCLIGKTTEIG